jgi:uncharacterized protein YyaL (SSP411 family)
MRPLAILALPLCALACVAERGKLTNQMAQSSTRYLARAAREPVGWQAWGRGVFTLAARLDRPILLYVGAEDCRWCAAMDRETFADATLGAVIDSLFVPIRLDRDEHPDIARRYEVAVHLLTGLRGYPLTVFLTPEGSAFFGGTYFPADDPLTGRGMKQILPEVARSFAQNRAFVVRQAALVRQLAFTREVGAHGVLQPRAIEAGIERVRAALVEALRTRAPLSGLLDRPAAVLLFATAARGGDTSGVAVARAVLDYVADSGEVVAAASDRNEPQGVVRAGMLRNLAVGWVFAGEPRYRDAARRILRSLGSELERTKGRSVFADREAYVIEAVLEASLAVDDSVAPAQALGALDSLLDRAYGRGRGVRHVVGGSGAAGALLQDQVHVAGAALAAYAATGAVRYLGVAEDLAMILARDFADSTGGYFDVPRVDAAAPALADRTKPIWDDLLPGANAWAARMLLQLADATGEPAYRRRAEATLEAFAGMMPGDEVRASSYLAVAQSVLSLP